MKKNIFVINGSASSHSSNERLIEKVKMLFNQNFSFTVFDELKKLPHFSPELSSENTPDIIQTFRNEIEAATGVIICTPEYVFSIPSGLKNALEWCVATTIFLNKPIGLITASANGIKGHEELQLIMKTLTAHFTPETTLLIQGVKGKIDLNGNITNSETLEAIEQFVTSFQQLIFADTTLI